LQDVRVSKLTIGEGYDGKLIIINDGSLSEIYFDYGEMIYTKFQKGSYIEYIPFGKFMSFKCSKYCIDLVNENGEAMPLDLCYRFVE